MIPLVGAVQELEIAREEAERVLAEVAEETGDARAHADRHDDRAAARRADRRPDRRGRRVLLLRHQRPDPDGLGLLPRRRRGLVLQPATSSWASSASRRSRRWTPRASAGWSGSPSRKAGPPARTSRSASAASTAATPSRCTSSTRSAWTTCPARRSACRSPGSRRAGPRSWRPWGAATAGDAGLRRARNSPVGCRAVEACAQFRARSLRQGPRPGAAQRGPAPAGGQDAGGRGRLRRLPAHPADALAGVRADRP